MNETPLLLKLYYLPEDYNSSTFFSQPMARKNKAIYIRPFSEKVREKPWIIIFFVCVLYHANTNYVKTTKKKDVVKNEKGEKEKEKKKNQT